MTQQKQLPDLRGQWIDLVEVQGPVQLPTRPRQMIDSYITIWQRDQQLWAGDGFGTVSADGIVNLYDQLALYINDCILWPGQNGFNTYVRTVDLAGLWIDDQGNIHALSQLVSPVELNQTVAVIGQDREGQLCGYLSEWVHRPSGRRLTARLSNDCLQLQWSDGAVWKRHLDVAGEWISIKNKLHRRIESDGLKVTIGGVPGVIDPVIWYVNAVKQPFPGDKTKGGIDLDSTAIHWSDYVGWQRYFNLEGEWRDSKGASHVISEQKLQDATEYRRFPWQFSIDGHNHGLLIRNWVQITTKNKTLSGMVNFDSNRIDWVTGDVWCKS
ncbi:MAG: hypothetical protein Tsb002_06470 [Wenzhouxiangellaceae bacterium]